VVLRPLGNDAVNVVIDMQRMFAERTAWQVPALDRAVPAIVRLVQRRPEATLFTRFCVPRTPAEAPGEWRRYFERWPEMTLDAMDESLLDLVPELAQFAPPAEILDKTTYGGFSAPGFLHAVQRRQASTLVLSGAETDVCLLSTALQAVDRGWRVVVVEDAVASSAAPCHEAAICLLTNRFASQVELARTDEVLRAWR
jgi:nicotinamidase-related amidase